VKSLYETRKELFFISKKKISKKGMAQQQHKILVAVSGWYHSGKDTVAHELVQHGFQQLAFAKTLKDHTAQQYGFPREWCDTAEGKQQPLLDRPVQPRDPFADCIVQQLVSDSYRHQLE